MLEILLTNKLILPLFCGVEGVRYPCTSIRQERPRPSFDLVGRLKAGLRSGVLYSVSTVTEA